jgi:hypothetical protein
MGASPHPDIKGLMKIGQRIGVPTPTTDVWPRKTFVGSIEVLVFAYELISLFFTFRAGYLDG